MTFDQVMQSAAVDPSDLQLLFRLVRLAQQLPEPVEPGTPRGLRELRDALRVTPQSVHSVPAGAPQLRLQRVEGGELRGQPGTRFSPAVRVTIGDRAEAGIPVRFMVTGGGGRLEGAEQVTRISQSGDAVASPEAWILGDRGANTIVAVAGYATLELSAFAEDPPQRTPDTGQSASAGPVKARRAE